MQVQPIYIDVVFPQPVAIYILPLAGRKVAGEPVMASGRQIEIIKARDVVTNGRH